MLAVLMLATAGALVYFLWPRNTDKIEEGIVLTSTFLPTLDGKIEQYAYDRLLDSSQKLSNAIQGRVPSEHPELLDVHIDLNVKLDSECFPSDRSTVILTIKIKK